MNGPGGTIFAGPMGEIPNPGRGLWEARWHVHLSTESYCRPARYGKRVSKHRAATGPRDASKVEPAVELGDTLLDAFGRGLLESRLPNMKAEAKAAADAESAA